MKDWAAGQQKLTVVQQQIGRDLNEGLRGAVTADMNALNKGLFAMFRKASVNLKQSIDVFIEQREIKHYEQIAVTIGEMESVGKEYSLLDFLQPKLVKLKASTEALANAIFSVKSLSQQVDTSYAALAAGVAQASESFDQQLVFAKTENATVSDRRSDNGASI